MSKYIAKKNINTLERANKWLSENHPKYTIVRWSGTASDKSTFLNTESNEHFEYEFSRFRAKIAQYPDRHFGATPKEIAKKSQDTKLARYGFAHALQIPQFKKKQEQTSMKRHGVKNAMQDENIKEKQQKSLFESHGVINPRQSKEISEKAKKSLKKRIGVEYPYQNKEIINKANEKAWKTKIEKGLTTTINGKTLREIAIEKGMCYSAAQKINVRYGSKFLLEYKKNRTNIEQAIKEVLDRCGVSYVYNKRLCGTQTIPDFVIESHKLIIECDGLYYHSEKRKLDKNYHKIKKSTYETQGYKSLFFREDEILNKPEIIESIIKNKLHLLKPIGASKCKIAVLDKFEAELFFQQNHLMGKGAGKTFALTFNEEVVAAICVKRCKNNGLDISRFATKTNTSVNGGFSRLLKAASGDYGAQISFIQNFIDKRYGEGEYLKNFGFEKKTEYLSFAWTDCKKSFHRMKFKSNDGYRYGFVKIWDCGQAKWVLDLKIIPRLSSSVS